MTEAEIQAASEFWASGPGAKVMARWRIEWPVDNGPQFIKRLLPPDADMGWGICLLRDEQAVREIPLPDRAAVHTIHGHYLEMLRGPGPTPYALAYTDDSRGHAIEVADEKGWRWRVCEPTLHEALKAAMEAAFGEPT